MICLSLSKRRRSSIPPNLPLPSLTISSWEIFRLATELESRRLIYVAMTRAREKLVLEWPSYLAGKDGLTYWSILASEASVSHQDATITVGDTSFPCLIGEGASELPDDFGVGDGYNPRSVGHHRSQSDTARSCPGWIAPGQCGAFGTG